MKRQSYQPMKKLAARRARRGQERWNNTAGGAMTFVERIIEQIRELFSAPDLPHFIDDDIMPPWERDRSLDRHAD